MVKRIKDTILDTSNYQVYLTGKEACINLNIERELLQNIEKIHTTKLGVTRIKRNLSLDTDHVVDWCKTRIKSENATITRQGKNWYVNVDACVITINAHSFTIITAHKEKKNTNLHW